MFEWMPQSSNDVLCLKVKGKIAQVDYEELERRFQSATERFEKVHLLVDLRDFGGIEPKAIWSDLRFDFKHLQQIAKLAVVGDSLWENLLTQVSQPLVRFHARYFDVSKMDEALEWVREGSKNTEMLKAG